MTSYEFVGYMLMKSADVVICGAGIAGIATAYQLTVKQGVKSVVLVDERAPLTLTSDKSTECYRNWWPGPGDAMVALMNRSIDILENFARETNNVFHLNRRGYLYATADRNRIAVFKRAADEAASLGAGPVRVHDHAASEYQPASPSGFDSPLTGADLLTDSSLIEKYFPYFARNTVAVLHARRCGWFSAQQLGMYELERARTAGAQFISARVTAIEVDSGRVRGVVLNDGTRIATENFVIAAGPFLKEVAMLLDVDVPVFNERHVKVNFDDMLGAIPREAGLLIWADPVRIPWSDDERELFASLDETRWLLDEFPAGVHGRPEGGRDGGSALMLWTYDLLPVEPTLPITWDPHYPEIVLRGMAVMLPALRQYIGKAPRPVVDGGYYCKTRENRPLIGPLSVDGAYVIGALSGFGLMASSAAAELLAQHITHSTLPSYARAFMLERYDDAEYQTMLANWGESGQL